MAWKECSLMEERLQFVATRRADDRTLQGVRDLTQDRVQDLRSLSRSSRPYRYAEVAADAVRLQFSDQRNVRSKSRKRLDKTGDSLSGSVENAIVALRIVEAITESSVGLCAGPIRRAPGIWFAPKSKERCNGRLRIQHPA